MRQIKLSYICILIPLIINSCIGPNSLQHTLNKYNEPLEYCVDSETDTLKRNQTVFLKVSDKLVLHDSTTVNEDGVLIVPLIIAGGYKYDFTVTLGRNNVTPSISQFVYDSFLTEAKRSGNFNISDNIIDSDYILELTLLECQISCKYHKDAIGYGHYSKYNWILKPVTGQFKVEVRLLKGENSVYCSIYASSKSAQPETLKFDSEKEMNKKMMENFAKTASLEIKEIIESGIRDINKRVR